MIAPLKLQGQVPQRPKIALKEKKREGIDKRRGGGVFEEE